MRALLVTHEFVPNGAVVMLFHLARHLIEDRGWQVDVLASQQATGMFREQFEKIGAKCVETTDLRQYDVAVVNTVINAQHVPRLAKSVRTIFWVHEGFTVVKNTLQRPAEFAVPFQSAHKIVFEHKFQIEKVFASFLEGIPPSRIEIISLGIPPVSTERHPVERDRGRKRILYVGSLYSRKRPGDLIRAVTNLKDPGVECVLIGWTGSIKTLGPEAQETLASRQDLFTVAASLDREKLLDYYAGSDVFCLPSADETFGIAAVEAGLFGLPLVLTDLPAYEGLWTHGVNCLMVPVHDPELLRWMLRILLDDAALRDRLGRAAKETARKYSLDSFLRRFDAILDEVSAQSL